LSHPPPTPALAPLPSSFPPSPEASPSAMTMWEMLASAFQSAYARGHIERERVIQTLRVGERGTGGEGGRNGTYIEKDTGCFHETHREGKAGKGRVSDVLR
jgi:hypothetical protein